MLIFIKNFFKFQERKTTFKKEIIGALTTFSSIAYIMVVNPAILSDAQMNFGSVLVASIIMTSLATFLMGLLSNYPFAIAPGIGVSAYLSYSVVIKNNIPWEKAFLAIFFVGILLLLLTIFKVRKKILASLPPVLLKAIICGIGLFLFFVGLSQIGVIKASHAAFISFGSFFSFKTFIAFVSFILIVVLLFKKQSYAFILVILLNWVISLILGTTEYQGLAKLPPSLLPTFFKVDFTALYDTEFYRYFFALFLIGLFDSSAGLMTLLKAGHYLDKNNNAPAMQKALLPDSITSSISPLIGTSTMAIHIESLSGMKVGSKTGFSSILVSLLFLSCLFLYPLLSNIPESAIAPVLMILGCYMMADIKGLNWKDISDVIPFFVTIIIMPLTFSIYLGFAFGFISYTLLKILMLKFKEIPAICYIFSILFIIELFFLK